MRTHTPLASLTGARAATAADAPVVTARLEGPIHCHVNSGVDVVLRVVDGDTWRGVSDLEVTPAQRAFVREASHYLAQCCYGTTGWRPLAMLFEEQVIGFLMWAVDPEDGSCWFGGVLVDRAWQGRGYGKQALRAAIDRLADSGPHRHFALSYHPDNTAARSLYANLGFVETGEMAEDEIVARLDRGVNDPRLSNEPFD